MFSSVKSFPVPRPHFPRLELPNAVRANAPRQPPPVAPPAFYNRGEVRSIGGLEYEVPQSRLYCLCIHVALCSTALQCICRVIRRSSTTMKSHTYYIIFGRPPTGEASPLPSLAAPLRGNAVSLRKTLQNMRDSAYDLIVQR